MGRLFRRLFVAVGLAALAGYLAGLLTAPKSGKETRDDVRRAAMTGMSEAERQLKNLSSELAALVDQAKERAGDFNAKAKKEMDDLVAKAKVAREKAREVVSAVHEGDAEDEDLRVAVNEATRALNHLKDYLKK